MTYSQLRWHGVPEDEAEELTCPRCDGTGVTEFEITPRGIVETEDCSLCQ